MPCYHVAVRACADGNVLRTMIRKECNFGCPQDRLSRYPLLQIARPCATNASRHSPRANKFSSPQSTCDFGDGKAVSGCWRPRWASVKKAVGTHGPWDLDTDLYKQELFHTQVRGMVRKMSGTISI